MRKHKIGIGFNGKKDSGFMIRYFLLRKQPDNLHIARIAPWLDDGYSFHPSIYPLK
ncbi:hypothetical protein [Paenibacillus sp. DS2015]|uniref:hypothetical protein n=1 Tax=Paenibacillus sp. DS2015 TaxID=3373917 RepID=UPI003D1B17A2